MFSIIKFNYKSQFLTPLNCLIPAVELFACRVQR